MRTLKQNQVLNNLIFLTSMAGLLLLLSTPSFAPSFVDQQSDQFALFFLTTHRGLMGLFASGLIVTVLQDHGVSSLLKTVLEARFWYPLAQTSYAIYLIHLPIAFMLTSALYQRVDSYLVWYLIPSSFAVLIISALLSCLLFVLIEKPMLNMRPNH